MSLVSRLLPNWIRPWSFNILLTNLWESHNSYTRQEEIKEWAPARIRLEKLDLSLAMVPTSSHWSSGLTQAMRKDL